jgi:uncharacterized protein (TIGR02145 family)
MKRIEDYMKMILWYIFLKLTSKFMIQSTSSKFIKPGGMGIQSILIVVLFCFSNLLSGQKSGSVNSGTFIDPRDSHTYKTIKIASQIWMAENLVYKTEEDGCWAYDDNLNNVEKYGYLYKWQTAKNVCPSGWRLPSDNDWASLISFLGGESIAGGKLKETGTTNWKNPNDGATNETGFNALPAGDRVFYGPYTNVGTQGQWWSSSAMDIGTGYTYYVSCDNSKALKGFAHQRYGLSVRCLLEPEKPKNHSYDYLNPELSRQKIGTYYDPSFPGQEELKYDNGIYKGQVLNGLPNGKGRFTFSTGEIYEGDFVNDIQQGKGKYLFRNGDIYSGEFFNDEISGKGVYISENGAVYDGEWKGSKYNGKGVLKYAGGEVYEGEFVNGARNGIGKYTDLIGNISEGIWLNGKLVTPKQNTISNKIDVGARGENNRLENKSTLTQIVGLVAFYPFNGNANDESGNGNNGTVSGAILTNDRFGNANSAYSFDGSDDYIRIPHSNKLNFQTFTISLWIKVKGEGTPAKEHWGLICKNNSDSGYQDQFSLFINRTKIENHPPYSVMGRIGDGNTALANTFSSKNVNDGNWHQIIFRLDKNLDRLDLLVDNVLVATDKFKSNLINNSDPINIGYWAGYYNFFNGCIDDIMIFNKALNENEISSLYHSKNESDQEYIQIKENNPQNSLQEQRIKFDEGLYVGQARDGKPNGKGKFTFNSGETYEGDFVDNAFNGIGKYIQPNGTTYVGEWKNGKQNGKGKVNYSNGMVYEGDFENGNLNGEGKLVDSKGNISKGHWETGKLVSPKQNIPSNINEPKNIQTNQNQKRILDDGSIYEGELVNGIMEGKGKYLFKDGTLYVGDFKNNQLEGYGKFTYPSGKIYEGEVVRGKRQGAGLMFYKNGKTMFDGDWLDDKLDGLGKYYDENGKLICEGEWIDNKLDGKGKIFYENGDSYEGDFQSGKMSGSGKYYYPNGDTYIGIFINDKPEGRGRFVYANGDLHEGQWKDGRFVEISQTTSAENSTYNNRTSQTNSNKSNEGENVEQTYPNLARLGLFLNQAYNSPPNRQGDSEYQKNTSDLKSNQKGQNQPECSHCRGTGRCPSCSKVFRVTYWDGYGYKSENETRLGKVICETCRGSGKIYGTMDLMKREPNYKICYVCKGTGWKNCPECNSAGYGEHLGECTNCRGTGHK